MNRIKPYQRVGRCTKICSRAASSAAFEPSVSAAREQCLALLRKFDTAAYLQVGYIPRPARNAFIALQALNIEIARISDVTSSENVASLRMQFWKESMDKALAGTPPQEPAAILLAAAENELRQGSQGRMGLKKKWLHRMVDARREYLGGKPFPTLDLLETFGLQSVTADHVASHIGKAAGIIAILRGVPLVAFPQQPHGGIGAQPRSQAKDMVQLPLDVMARHDVREEQVLRQGAQAPNLRDAVFYVATRANDHLITAREMLQNLSEGKDVGHAYEYGDEQVQEKDGGSSIGGITQQQQQKREIGKAFPALLAAVNLRLWLGRLEQCNFDLFDARVRHVALKLPISMFWAAMRQRL